MTVCKNLIKRRGVTLGVKTGTHAKKLDFNFAYVNKFVSFAESCNKYSPLFVFACALFGASPTTSASILVEFGGNDWAAGCVVAHVFSHMYISPAVSHTPHARDLLFGITLCMRGPRSFG